MILTPEQIEGGTGDWICRCKTCHDGGDIVYNESWYDAVYQTLRAYASIVERVAEDEGPFWFMHRRYQRGYIYRCKYCGGTPAIPEEELAAHAPDCLYLEARKLRNKP